MKKKFKIINGVPFQFKNGHWQGMLPNEIVDMLNNFDQLVNNPEIDNFLEGVRLESAHQTEKHGFAFEVEKSPHDYILVMDYLKGKQVTAIWGLDVEKYKHHLITLSAVCLNAHLKFDHTGSGVNRHFFGEKR